MRVSHPASLVGLGQLGVEDTRCPAIKDEVAGNQVNHHAAIGQSQDAGTRQRSLIQWELDGSSLPAVLIEGLLTVRPCTQIDLVDRNLGRGVNDLHRLVEVEPEPERVVPFEDVPQRLLECLQIHVAFQRDTERLVERHAGRGVVDGSKPTLGLARR